MAKQDQNTTEVVILVTGLSGTGKSTFINALLAEDVMPVGHGLSPFTKDVRCALFNSHLPEAKGRRIVIVDTPGFDNTYGNDIKVLELIASWLEARSPSKALLGGVIYLHEINQDRLATLAPVSLGVLRKSFGASKETFSRVALTTTKWSRIGEKEGEDRVNELRQQHWKPLIDGGMKVERFADTQESARKIVESLVKELGDQPGFDIKAKMAEFRKLQASTGDKTHGVREQFLRFFGLLGLFGRQ
ncbi:hypothetical protein CVT26_012225 [Gymnopilus dilepis]|uniref:G domain-containing protein n=1 Tax=Gymnopilus dilepis TaxID=231916 RepID=A0A409YQ73_9AGAR|nr:hypothetical protein CVT26_012225 [Gymnopilus dilepis]